MIFLISLIMKKTFTLLTYFTYILTLLTCRSHLYMHYFTYFTYIWHFVKFATKRCSYPEPKPKACPQYGKHFELHIVTWLAIYICFIYYTYLLTYFTRIFICKIEEQWRFHWENGKKWKMMPRAPQSERKEPPGCTKVSPRAPKVNQKEPKGDQRDAKMEPKWSQGDPKRDNGTPKWPQSEPKST